MQIVGTASEEEALRQVALRHFDLIVLDIRQPRGGEFVLIQAIKTFFADSVICVIAGRDTAWRRDSALRHGADHFMTEEGATAGELADLVDSLLRSSFLTLIVDRDEPSRSQLTALLAARWPAMAVAVAADAGEGVGRATALKPDLVLLELGLPGGRDLEVVHGIRNGSPRATLVGMADDASPPCLNAVIRSGMDHCVPLSPAGHTELLEIVKALRPGRLLHQ
jgi:DNA-binding NarL/FixJ family response regulator